MMAVILAGGLGMRLRPYTMNIPKPLLPLGDTPTMEIVLRQLADQGFTRVVLTLGHLPELIVAMLGDGQRYGLRIDYQLEEEPLGTAGPLRLVDDLDETFLVMNGDLLTTVDYAGVLRELESRDSAATIVLARREVHIDYGVVHTAPSGSLERYEEKPTLDYYVSTGIYGLTRRSVGLIPEGRFDMPSLMTRLTETGEDVHCLKSDAYWQDIGRFDDYQRASADFADAPHRFLPGLPVPATPGAVLA
ncbi:MULTISPECIES: sugar phosphate nucleotidyltransferase [unclassified Nocardioides]|uniref:sugar phosphate nucleotidyltransferase n=1 Tax=unclassified Nocardioides TaxID=2615069 RepID=UPI00361FC066